MEYSFQYFNNGLGYNFQFFTEHFLNQEKEYKKISILSKHSEIYI